MLFVLNGEIEPKRLMNLGLAASAAWELLTNLRGSDMLGFKCIMNTDGKPVVIQGVQHIFHPPVILDEWPSDDHDTRIVFITKNIEAELIKSLFNPVGAVKQNSESIKELN